MSVRILTESEPLSVSDLARNVSMHLAPREDHPFGAVFCNACPKLFELGPDSELVPTVPAGWAEVDHGPPREKWQRHFTYYCPACVVLYGMKESP